MTVRLRTSIDLILLGMISAAGFYHALQPHAVPAAFAAAAEPTTLIIPEINVNAPVVPVGMTAQGALGVPNDAIHVAWYSYGPKPGDPGTAVIDGHLDTIHEPEAVFYNLGRLHPGDSIEVQTSANQMLTFKVRSVATIPYNATTTNLFSTTSSIPQLNLITCAGEWMPDKHMYDERIAVFSQLTQ